MSPNVTRSLWPRMKPQALSYRLILTRLMGAYIYEHVIKPAEEERFRILSEEAASLARTLSEPVLVAHPDVDR